MNVGDKVAVSGNCTCPQYRMKDCYHRPDRGRQSPILRHIFRDKTSMWIQNRYGFGTMEKRHNLVRVSNGN